MSSYNDVLTQLSKWAIQSSIETLQHEDRLTLGLREALRNGGKIDDLSEITGLTPDQIRRRTRRELHVLSDLETLAG